MNRRVVGVEPAVEVGSDADEARITRHTREMLGVRHHVVDTSASIDAQVTAVEADSENAVASADLRDDVIRQLALLRAECTRADMAGDDGATPNLERVLQ